MLKEKDLAKIQNKINYQFTNKTLLRQAFTRKSFSANNGGEDNEVLEFYGDRILDLAVIKDFYDFDGGFNAEGEFVSSKTVGELDRENRNLVKNINLAEQISRLGLIKYLQVEKLFEKSIMKVKADLFEAILGAVALDSNWNLQKIGAVFHTMMYCREETKEQTYNPEECINLFETEIWKLNIFKTENSYTKMKNGYKCSFLMNINENYIKIHEYGNTQHFAKIAASWKGYIILMLLAKKTFIKEMSYTEQLYHLYSCRLISEPRFHFEFYSVNSETPVALWKCFGSLSDSNTEYESEGPSRFDSMEQVSYAILCNILGIEPVEFEIEENTGDIVAQTAPHSTETTLPSSTCTDNIIVFNDSETYKHGQGLLKYILSHYEATA